jgi:hypothetical protein
VRDRGIWFHCVMAGEAVAGAGLHRPGNGPEPRSC